MGEHLRLDSRMNSRGLGASGALCGLWGYMAVIFPAVYLQGCLFQVGFDGFCLATDSLPMIGHLAHLQGTVMGIVIGLGSVLLTRGRRFR